MKLLARALDRSGFARFFVFYSSALDGPRISYGRRRECACLALGRSSHPCASLQDRTRYNPAPRPSEQCLLRRTRWRVLIPATSN